MFHANVAEGIHRVEDAYTNWYIVEGDDGLTIVDAGVPTSWQSLEHALSKLGRPFSDIRALILTHAHFDHIGIAERLRRDAGAPVYLHDDDVPLSRHPRQYSHERPRSVYLATQPRALPIIATFVRNRAFWPKPVEVVNRFEDGKLDVPGRPEVVTTPGHTVGHVSFPFRRSQHAHRG
jgi:glyoxylase-like metal-dependent hydrolase (beta-lactamase superfamily II)